MVRLARLKRLRARDFGLLARALVAVATARLYLVFNHHDGLRRLIDANPVPHGRAVSNGKLAAVAWSVRTAARLVPGATCLTQASAGQLLLARQGFATTVRLSIPARTGPDGALAPHAWLMAGDVIVLGGGPAEYMGHRPLHDFDLPGAEPAA